MSCENTEIYPLVYSIFHRNSEKKQKIGKIECIYEYDS